MTKTKPFAPRLSTAILAAAGCAVLAGCAVGPNYRRPEVPMSASFKSATKAEKPQPTLGTDWWTLFQDEDLTRLSQEALRANQTIQAAIARLDAAHAATRSAAGGFFPAVSIAPTAQRGRSISRVSGNSVGVIGNSYSLPADLSYELDVWGRLRRAYEAAHFTELASADDLALVQQTVVSDLAQGYFSLRFYDAEVTILQENLGLYREQLKLTQTKFNAGLALQTDVLQAQTQVDTATSTLIDAQRSRVKQEHALAILLGRAPADFALEPKPLSPLVPTVPAGLPSDLLNRRPDVATAEHQLVAANAQVGVAVADFFPSFSLTGLAGFQSTAFSQLTNWSNRVWSVGAGLNLPIFQGGKLTAALAAAKANYAESVANYRGAVLTALQDVEDQLSDLHLLAQKAESLEATLVHARENYRLTQIQYKQGLTTYLNVINANQTLLNAEITSAQTQSQRLATSVLLMKALGGGWTGPTAK